MVDARAIACFIFLRVVALGQHDDVGRGDGECAHAVHELDAVHDGHLAVCDQHRKPLSGEQRKRRLAVSRARDLDPAPFSTFVAASRTRASSSTIITRRGIVRSRFEDTTSPVLRRRFAA